VFQRRGETCRGSGFSIKRSSKGPLGPQRLRMLVLFIPVAHVTQQSLGGDLIRLNDQTPEA
jgi:hypothetical protein